jgi:hypothetical protein
MLAIEMLPGGHGDALVVEYGPASKPRRVLIDAGTASTWESSVRPRLVERNDSRYEVFVVTHVDEDHIGGSIRLLDDPDLKHRVDHIWFNGFVHSEAGGSVLGPIDGERLTRRIAKGGFKWNEPFPDPPDVGVGGPAVVPSEGELPRIELEGGAVVHLLSPDGPKLKRMAKEWKEVVEEAGLVPGEGTALEAKKPPIGHKEIAPLPDPLDDAALDDLAGRRFKADTSKANGSSIAFIFEFDGHRALLGADAYSPVLVSSLRRFAEANGEDRVAIDLFKLPHHGSRANVSSALLDVIDTDWYLVSSNGDNFGHPDDEVLARIIRSSTRAPHIHCNYRSDRTLLWEERTADLDATVHLPPEGTSGLRVEVG